MRLGRRQLAMALTLLARAACAQSAEHPPDDPLWSASVMAEWAFGRESSRYAAVLSPQDGTGVAAPVQMAEPVLRMSLQGSADRSGTDGATLLASWRVQEQRSGGANLLGFRILGADLRSQSVWAGVPTGIGVAWQRMWTGHEVLRNTFSIDADATFAASPSGFWSATASVGRYRHPGELAAIDAKAWSVGLLRRSQWSSGLLDVVDLALGLQGEHNQQRIAGLSSRRGHVRIATERTLGPWAISAGVLWQGIRYDGAGGSGLPSRKDSFVSWELSATLALDKHWHLRLATSTSTNRANLPAYLQDSKGWTFSLLRVPA